MLRKKLRAHSITADFKDALYKTQKHRNEKQDGYPVTRWGMKHGGGKALSGQICTRKAAFHLC